MSRIKGKNHTIILIGTKKYMYFNQHFNKLEIEGNLVILRKGLD